MPTACLTRLDAHRSLAFEYAFVCGTGLSRCGCRLWHRARTVRFETALPYRRLVSYKGQRNFVSSWWLETTGTYVPYESWVERDRVMLMDRACGHAWQTAPLDLRNGIRRRVATEVTGGYTPTGGSDAFINLAERLPWADRSDTW